MKETKATAQVLEATIRDLLKGTRDRALRQSLRRPNQEMKRSAGHSRSSARLDDGRVSVCGVNLQRPNAPESVLESARVFLDEQVARRRRDLAAGRRPRVAGQVAAQGCVEDDGVRVEGRVGALGDAKVGVGRDRPVSRGECGGVGEE